MKSCKNRSSGRSTNHPWLRFMKKFKEKHEEKCNYLNIRGPASKSREFSTGSFYDGGWHEQFGMHGYGVYTFPNGVIYEGEFFEGEFHGKGELRYKTSTGKVVMRGLWNKGLMTERTILFNDTLEHENESWQYCKMPDRRFLREYVDGVQPSGKSFMASCDSYAELPEGYIDCGDGFYDPTRKIIYQYCDYRGIPESVRRGPARVEQKWILENCRVGVGKKGVMTIGPREDLYEKYVEPTTLLEPVPPPPSNCMATRKQSTFGQSNYLDNTPKFYDPSKRITDSGLPERKFNPSPVPTDHKYNNYTNYYLST